VKLVCSVCGTPILKDQPVEYRTDIQHGAIVRKAVRHAYPRRDCPQNAA
jgi:hypothetical protein